MANSSNFVTLWSEKQRKPVDKCKDIGLNGVGQCFFGPAAILKYSKNTHNVEEM